MVPGVGLSNKAVPVGQIQVFCISFGQVDVLVQIALPGSLNDGVANCRAPSRFS